MGELQDIADAGNPTTSLARLARLAFHDSWQVRCPVGLNPSASRSTLFSLLDDAEPVVSACAVSSLLCRLKVNELRLLTAARPERRTQFLDGCETHIPIGMATPSGLIVSDSEFNHLRAALGYPPTITTDWMERMLEVAIMRP